MHASRRAHAGVSYLFTRLSYFGISYYRGGERKLADDLETRSENLVDFHRFVQSGAQFANDLPGGYPSIVRLCPPASRRFNDRSLSAGRGRAGSREKFTGSQVNNASALGQTRTRGSTAMNEGISHARDFYRPTKRLLRAPPASVWPRITSELSRMRSRRVHYEHVKRSFRR